MNIFKWLLLPASILAVLGVMGFVLADTEALSTLRAIAASVVILACLLAFAAAIIGWYNRHW
jgi:hypothetical protein